MPADSAYTGHFFKVTSQQSPAGCSLPSSPRTCRSLLGGVTRLGWAGRGWGRRGLALLLVRWAAAREALAGPLGGLALGAAIWHSRCLCERLLNASDPRVPLWHGHIYRQKLCRERWLRPRAVRSASHLDWVTWRRAGQCGQPPSCLWPSVSLFSEGLRLSRLTEASCERRHKGLET